MEPTLREIFTDDQLLDAENMKAEQKTDKIRWGIDNGLYDDALIQTLMEDHPEDYQRIMDVVNSVAFTIEEQHKWIVRYLKSRTPGADKELYATLKMEAVQMVWDEVS